MTATTETTTTPALVVTVPVDALRDGLRSVIPGASTDKTVPILNAVRLTLKGDGTVTMHTTDRYVLMEYVATSAPDLVPAGEFNDVTFTLALDDAKALVKAIPTRPAAWEDATLDVNGDGMLSVTLSNGAAFTFRAVEGDYPPVRRLFPEYDNPGVDGVVGLGHKQLSQMMTATKHLGKNPSLAFHFGDTIKPAMVYVEGVDAWRGLIMPRRLSTTR